MIDIIVYDKISGAIIVQCNTPDELVGYYTEQGKYEVLHSVPVPGATHVVSGIPVNQQPAPDTMSIIRAMRDVKLAACDWTQMPDVPLTVENKAEWAVYRQALRDFPETCDIDNPVWPTPPV